MTFPEMRASSFDEDATTILAIYIGRRTTTTYSRS
jgi:hypothetical protein